DEFQGSITTWVDLTEKCFGKYYMPSRNVMETKAKKDLTNTIFKEWLVSKFANHKMMDPFNRKVLRNFWKKVDNNEGVTNKGFSDLEEVDMELFTHDIQRTKTYEEYENKLNNEFDEPSSENRVPYEICDHICEPFHFKNRETKWPTFNSNKDGFCNGGELPEMVRVGYMTYFQDHEWNFHKLDYELLVKLEECWWKINDHEYSPFANWRDHIRGPYANINTSYDSYLDGRNGNANNNSDIQDEEEQKDEEICELFDDLAQEPLIYKITRFEMIKYSFGQEEKYVAIKEYDYDDLSRTNDDACHAYQEIFRNMDEGWLVTRAE
ncbi:hypothetical protein Tco_1390181, partial [Tanacetum coccineum]